MASKLVAELARLLMACPAAPYFEQLVASEVRRICEDYQLEHRSDDFGNILVSLRTAPKHRLLALSAHMDHPGFRILRRLGHSKFLAEFLGGVPDSYFKPGVRVRLFPGSIPARLGKRAG